ncbi:MAG: chorismate mutase [Acidobacteriota bacterium]|nr:chorismate mutase [Acidobacteriota bacterium]
MTIEDWRAEIDAVDAELLRLLNARATLAIRVGESKRSAGLSVTDGAREREVVERARRANAGPLDSAAVTRLFRRIIHESRRAEAAALKESEAAMPEESGAQMEEALP